MPGIKKYDCVRADTVTYRYIVKSNQRLNSYDKRSILHSDIDLYALLLNSSTFSNDIIDRKSGNK
jgi:hypothetical protein